MRRRRDLRLTALGEDLPVPALHRRAAWQIRTETRTGARRKRALASERHASAASTGGNWRSPPKAGTCPLRTQECRGATWTVPGWAADDVSSRCRAAPVAPDRRLESTDSPQRQLRSLAPRGDSSACVPRHSDPMTVGFSRTRVVDTSWTSPGAMPASCMRANVRAAHLRARGYNPGRRTARAARTRIVLQQS